MLEANRELHSNQQGVVVMEKVAESAWATSREWMCYREEDYAFVQEAQRDPLDREIPE